MDLLERLEKIKYTEHLIITRQANSVKELAEKLNVSRRQILEQIKIMRKMGAPVAFDKRTNKYYYSENKYFNFNCQ